MKRDLSYFSISKIYIFLGIVSVAGIILLFFYPRSAPKVDEQRANRDLINQVLHAAVPVIKAAWNTPSLYIKGKDCQLPEIVGEAYLECRPQGWQCLWNHYSHLDIDYGGKKYQLKSSGVVTFIKRQVAGIHSSTGYITQVEIPELHIKREIFLSNTCHEMYLPQRTYAYGEVGDPRDKGLLWDNEGRKLFIDKFYVSEGDIVEWKNYLGEKFDTQTPWMPAKLKLGEQKEFCAFHGKKRLMAHLFDASQMTPFDLKIVHPDFIVRPDTPWQRDWSRTFFYKGKDPSYRPAPKDCQLAQVLGCEENYFKTDSVSWAGVAFGLGFEEETFFNPFEPTLSLKKSSKSLPAGSEWHKLGRRSTPDEEKDYAFRCYREVL